MGVRTRVFVRLCDEQRCKTETTAPRVLTCMCAHVCMCVCMCVCVCVCVYVVFVCVWVSAGTSHKVEFEQ